MIGHSDDNDDIRGLIAELVDRWVPMMQPRSWPGRLALLAEIHEQLLDDIGGFDVFAAVSPGFIAGLIDRLGGGPVACEEQGHIYANSGSERHRQLAGEWFNRSRGTRAVPCQPSPSHERRATPRRRVDLPTSIVADGRRIDCRLIDISNAGALVETASLTPDIGATLDLDVPNHGVATAAVVRLVPPHFALAFRRPVDAKTVH